MAYTLKSTGIAANCVNCFAVDQDGTTIKDFASSSVNSTMTTTGVTTSTSSWKSTSRGYFTISDGNYIVFGANKPSVNAPSTGNQVSVFVAFSSIDSKGYYGQLFGVAASSQFIGLRDDNKLAFMYGGSTFLDSTNSISQPATARSIGFAWNKDSSCDVFHGLESGSLSSVKSTGDTAAAPVMTSIPYLGRGNSAGNDLLGKYHVVAIFNTALTLSDMQSLHNDWFGTLFDAPASVPTAPSGVTTSSTSYTSTSVSWTDNSSDETGFKVRYSPSPYSSWTTATASVASSPYLVTGLSDGTSYKAAVAAFNAGGDSTWAESGVFTTSTLSKLRPNADTSTGSWSASSGSVLYSMIDETSADDADYITTSSATTCKLKFETSTDPSDNSNHRIYLRARSTSGTLTVRLVQGDPAETTIVSWVPTLTSSFATYQYDLSTAEASVITDYSALYLKLTSS